MGLLLALLGAQLGPRLFADVAPGGSSTPILAIIFLVVVGIAIVLIALGIYLVVRRRRHRRRQQ